MMKILHLLKSEPDENTKVLIELLSKDKEAILYPLYEDETDYEKMLDLVFECDQTISWW
jgi:hypothetical protein